MKTKTNKDDASAEADARRRHAWLEEKVAWLDTCHEALDAPSLVVLDEVIGPFMTRHYGKIRQRALHWDVPEADAADLVQEVFFALHGRVRDHGVTGSLMTTLHIVTRGKLLHAARARRRAPSTVCLPSSGSALPESSVDLVRAIDLRTARRFVHELSEDHQAAVNKVILEGKTGAESAAELEISEGTLWSRLRAAVEVLRARMARWLPESEREAA